MSSLSTKQKALLSRLARKAYCADLARARKSGNTLLETPDEYRRREVAEACGKAGLRCCYQEDFGPVLSHFQDKLGASGQALKTLVRASSNNRRIVEYKILEALKKGGFSIGYAAAICRAQFRCSFEDASEKQLWCLCFTIKNRSKGRKNESLSIPK